MAEAMKKTQTLVECEEPTLEGESNGIYGGVQHDELGNERYIGKLNNGER